MGDVFVTRASLANRNGYDLGICRFLMAVAVHKTPWYGNGHTRCSPSFLAATARDLDVPEGQHMSPSERKESSNPKLKFYIFRNTSDPKVCCLVEALSLEEAKARVQQHDPHANLHATRKHPDLN
jgi:hypothetical protein